MRFTRADRQTIRQALDWAISNRRDQIGLHPSPNDYPSDIEALEDEIEQLQFLAYRMDSTEKE